MRRILLVLGFLGVTAMLVIAALPWWLGAGLGVAGRAIGFSFGHYERAGYAHFRLHDVVVQRSTVRVRIATVELETPVVWLWHRWTGRPATVVAGAWQTEVLPSSGTAAPASPRGWGPLRQKLMGVGKQLARWLPRAETGTGVVSWPGQRLAFGPAKWDGRTLRVSEIEYRGWRAAAEVAFATDGALTLAAAVPDGSLRLALSSVGSEVQGRGFWWDQPVDVRAHFGEQGWVPPEATFDADQWVLAGERVRLGKWYAQIHGGGHVAWRGGALRAEVAVEGEPAKAAQVPPLSVKLRGHADRETFVAEELDVRMPGAEAKLSDPVAVDRTGRLRTTGAKLTFSGDLAQLPWVEARGKVQGEGAIAADAAGRATIDFTVGGREIVFRETGLQEFLAKGRLAWPGLEIKSLTLRTPEGSELSATGGWDFQKREIVDAHLDARIRHELVARWLPAGIGFDVIVVSAEGGGPWRFPHHSGTLQAGGLFVPRAKTLLGGTVTWRGTGDVVEMFEAEITAAATKITASGAASRAGLELTGFRLSNGDATRLQLTKPARVRWSPTIAVEGLELTGPESRIEASGQTGEAGHLDLSLLRIMTDWFRDLVALPKPSWTIDALNVHGKWDGGPAQFTADTAVTVEMGNRRAAQLSAQLKGDANGIELRSLRFAEGQGEVVTAKGRLPLVLLPRQQPWWRLDPSAPWSLQAVTTRNPEFWLKLGDLIGVEFEEPEGRVELGGTPAAPRGEVTFRAARLAARPERFTWTWPTVEALDLRLTGEAGHVTLDRLSVKVEGQLLRAQGTVAIPAGRWRDGWKDPRALARRGTLHVEIPDADLAAAARFVPDYLAPKGRLQADLTVSPDATVAGFVRVRDAASRPLGPLGVLQEVNAELILAGRTIELRNVAAEMGGQQVTLKGRVEWPEGAEPLLDLTLKGDNLPFVRRAGLLVRGDLNLALQSNAAGRADIRGDVRLRESLFLTDVRSFLPNGTRGAESRPPYFAITTPSLEHWHLDVTVHGEKFMRLRTPVFNGTASARFRLGGTLGNPHVTGEATIDDGLVRLPFASFQVRQGEVRLTPEQTEPQLWVTATTRRYGYDVRMEITGPASAPNLVFTSSPPLETEQVLLMVMTGVAPNNEATTTDRQRAARFGAFFGQSLLGTLSGDSADADRLTIASGENISEQGRETYHIEYRLTDRVALTGEYDEFDEYYGGIKWRFYQKGGTKPDEPK